MYGSATDREEEISVLEYIEYFKNKTLLENPSMAIMTLVQYYKKLLRTQGLNNEDEDDIFRPAHASLRKKITGMIVSRPEIERIVGLVYYNLPTLKVDK